MAASLSAYWVKFFKGAGFPQDVATRHAVVFSNNRIKPDMLPELDKPSLKDMGITLMGDMIAILRYAKKVVEETTCERFLVDSEHSIVNSQVISKPVIKKTVVKVPNRSAIAAKVKAEGPELAKSIKTVQNATKSVVVKKKPVANPTRVISHYIDKEKSQVSLKRKLATSSDDSDSDREWSLEAQKKLKTVPEDDSVGYKVIMPKGTTLRSQKILKKALDQKRTVFDRLGDSSVTSTTNLAESTPTFNVTGLGKEVFKRNASVFNRLGDKDAKKDQLPYVGILKNGASSSTTTGILKTRSTTLGTTVLTTKKIVKIGPKQAGTMRADQEKKRKPVVSNAKQLVRLTKKININDRKPTTAKVIRKIATSSKLASEQISPLPAKSRLGTTGAPVAKQVTFNSITTVAHLKKPGVFSRLGV